MASERVTLEMSFQDGCGTLAVGQEHPLVAVFRRAVRTGTYSGSWVYLVVRPEASHRPKLLGTIAWTAGERFLYFPGYNGPAAPVQADDDLNGRNLDHATLELDRAASTFSEHIAALGDQPRSRGRFRRGVVDSTRLHPWFSLLLSDLARYEDLPATFRFDLAMPASDVDRRCRAMMGRGQRTSTSFPAPRGVGPHYYQLDVWAGRGEQWKERYADALPWPTIPGVVDDHLGEPCDRAAQRHEFDSDTGFVIVLTRPSGTLRTKGLLHAHVTPTAVPADQGRRGAG